MSLSLCVAAGLLAPAAKAQGPGAAPAANPVDATPLQPPEGGRRLAEDSPVWIADGAVHVDGKVVLREGVLEMFACPVGTKEHESVVAVDSPAFLLHTGLLAVGAEPGATVQFDPEYKPPTGDRIDVLVRWIDGGQVKTAKAQDWVRSVETKKAMELPFVFAGSGFWTNPDTGRQHYLAESGDLVCVSNFGAAMLDVPAPSTQQNGELWFEPFTERIPPIGTPVRLILKPAGEAGAGGEPPRPATPRDQQTSAAGTPDALKALRQAEIGVGSDPTLRRAWAEVAGWNADRLPEVLRAMRGATPLAENWLRTAADAIADARGARRLPQAALREFVQDRDQSPRARRAAWEYLRRADPDAAEAMLDDLVDDPSTEIRYDAVARMLAAAEQEADAGRKQAAYREALAAARTIDQIEQAAAALEELGEPTELADELGFVTRWRVAGPFDNRGGRGFDTVYPPEESLDPNASYEGHDEEGPQGPFGWKPFETDDRLGEVELNDAIGPHKGAVGYAWATLHAAEPTPVEIRYESKAATKFWVNGQLVGANETYHSGSLFDQYVAAAELGAGDNALLVKVCQNEQTEPWAQTWPIALRVTAPGGGAVEGVEVVAPPSFERTEEQDPAPTQPSNKP
ncbi:YdjY domain-containing protein [Botrimarina sp.]|uniref:YdjY domain-containing protein n=1 Tax=Botrimarina sp. TaxID=2795802 RepID=UPI0032EFCB01